MLTKVFFCSHVVITLAIVSWLSTFMERALTLPTSARPHSGSDSSPSEWTTSSMLQNTPTAAASTSGKDGLLTLEEEEEEEKKKKKKSSRQDALVQPQGAETLNRRRQVRAPPDHCHLEKFQVKMSDLEQISGYVLGHTNNTMLVNIGKCVGICNFPFREGMPVTSNVKLRAFLRFSHLNINRRFDDLGTGCCVPISFNSLEIMTPQGPIFASNYKIKKCGCR